MHTAGPNAAPQQLLRERRQRARLAAGALERAARHGVHLQLPANTKGAQMSGHMATAATVAAQSTGAFESGHATGFRLHTAVWVKLWCSSDCGPQSEGRLAHPTMHATCT